MLESVKLIFVGALLLMPLVGWSSDIHLDKDMERYRTFKERAKDFTFTYRYDFGRYNKPVELSKKLNLGYFVYIKSEANYDGRLDRMLWDRAFASIFIQKFTKMIECSPGDTPDFLPDIVKLDEGDVGIFDTQGQLLQKFSATTITREDILASIAPENIDILKKSLSNDNGWTLISHTSLIDYSYSSIEGFVSNGKVIVVSCHYYDAATKEGRFKTLLIDKMSGIIRQEIPLKLLRVIDGDQAFFEDASDPWMVKLIELKTFRVLAERSLPQNAWLGPVGLSKGLPAAIIWREGEKYPVLYGLSKPVEIPIKNDHIGTYDSSNYIKTSIVAASENFDTIILQQPVREWITASGQITPIGDYMDAYDCGISIDFEMGHIWIEGEGYHLWNSTDKQEKLLAHMGKVSVSESAASPWIGIGTTCELPNSIRIFHRNGELVIPPPKLCPKGHGGIKITPEGKYACITMFGDLRVYEIPTQSAISIAPELRASRYRLKEID